MSDINVTVLNAAESGERAVTTGTKAWELFADDPQVIAARVGGELRDLAHELADGDEVEGVAIDSPDGRDILRHSTAHVMAQAVQELFPEAKLGIGPPITDGFYYDFDVPDPFVPEDLEKIESRMRKIVKEGQKFSRRPISDGDAISELADEPYKLELIGLKGGASDVADAAEGAGVEVGGAELTIYDNLKRDGSLAWKRPVPRPAPADHQAHPGVQADAVGRGVLARRREEQAAAADLRHRLGVQGGARGAPAPDRGGRAARPPQARPRPRPLLLPRRDRLRAAGVPPQGRGDQAGDGGLRPPAGTSRRASSTSAPRTSPRRGCSTPPGTCRTTATGCSRRWTIEGMDYRLKAMNCPMHNLIFRSRGSGPTASCRCGCSSSARSTGTRSPASCTA